MSERCKVPLVQSVERMLSMSVLTVESKCPPRSGFSDWSRARGSSFLPSSHGMLLLVCGLALEQALTFGKTTLGIDLKTHVKVLSVWPVSISVPGLNLWNFATKFLPVLFFTIS